MWEAGFSAARLLQLFAKEAGMFLDALLWLPSKLLAPIFRPVTDMFDLLEEAIIED